MTMDYIVPTANNNQHRILWRGNVTAATTYTFSVFVKADVLNTITLLIYEDAPPAAVRASVGWNLTTGTEAQHPGPGWLNSGITPPAHATHRVSLRTAPPTPTPRPSPPPP